MKAHCLSENFNRYKFSFKSQNDRIKDDIAIAPLMSYVFIIKILCD